ncbi:hypothetical protein LXL04_029679 [Taraxacum kok-saghyz]
MVFVTTSAITPEYNRKAELTAFDETKTGVKGLIDAGITEVPRMFLLPEPENLDSNQSELTLPTIDFDGIDEDPVRRKEVIAKMKDALESWGFLQMTRIHEFPKHEHGKLMSYSCRVFRVVYKLPGLHRTITDIIREEKSSQRLKTKALFGRSPVAELHSFPSIEDDAIFQAWGGKEKKWKETPCDAMFELCNSGRTWVGSPSSMGADRVDRRTLKTGWYMLRMMKGSCGSNLGSIGVKRKKLANCTKC